MTEERRKVAGDLLAQGERGIEAWEAVNALPKLGWKGSAKLLAHVEAVLESVLVLAFDVSADTEYGRLRVELEATGKPIGPNDMLIAAHAYATGATLVTDNMGKFSCIHGLRVENWIR